MNKKNIFIVLTMINGLFLINHINGATKFFTNTALNYSINQEQVNYYWNDRLWGVRINVSSDLTKDPITELPKMVSSGSTLTVTPSSTITIVKTNAYNLTPVAADYANIVNFVIPSQYKIEVLKGQTSYISLCPTNMTNFVNNNEQNDDFNMGLPSFSMTLLNGLTAWESKTKFNNKEDFNVAESKVYNVLNYCSLFKPISGVSLDALIDQLYTPLAVDVTQYYKNNQSNFPFNMTLNLNSQTYPTYQLGSL